MEGKTALGASSPAKPALHMPEPLSTMRAATSSSHMVIRWNYQRYRGQDLESQRAGRQVSCTDPRVAAFIYPNEKFGPEAKFIMQTSSKGANLRKKKVKTLGQVSFCCISDHIWSGLGLTLNALLFIY